MASSDYAPINQGESERRGVSWWTVVVLLGATAAACILVTYFVTRAAYQTSTSATYNPSTRYVVPSRYEARLQFRLPYMNFTEPIDAYVDGDNGLMRLSYFNGMDTYIYNAAPNSTSFQVVPVYTTLTCLSQFSATAQPLQNLFPTLSLFQKTSTQEVITIPVPGEASRTYTCDVWQYNAGIPEITPNYTSTLPDAGGYVGTYKFYVDSVSGNPVSFKALGHNVVVGGSHYDEYWMDYLLITKVGGLAPSLFQPPAGMICNDVSQPFGPTSTAGGALGRANPLHDIHMLFPEGHEHRMNVFDSWAAEHSKTYATESERSYRASVFRTNMHFVNSGNRRGLTYTMRANHFADMTPEERLAYKGRTRRSGPYKMERHSASRMKGMTPPGPNGDPGAACNVYTKSGKPIPANVDWRSVSNGGTQPEPGRVNPAKDQGTCGSCWSFGFTGTIEGAVATKTGKLPKLSEQNILDCSWYYGNNACGGGEDFLGFAWLLQQNNGQLALDSSYGGYLNQNGFCHFSIKDGLTTNPFTKQPVVAGATITGCSHVTAQWNSTAKIVDDQTAVDTLSDALAQVGPISVSMDATVPDFYFYNKGYYYNPSCGNTLNDLDHTVLAVGYVTHLGQRYTIIRNSWSSHWGDNGYAYISQQSNNCGIATAAAFVTV